MPMTVALFQLLRPTICMLLKLMHHGLSCSAEALVCLAAASHADGDDSYNGTADDDKQEEDDDDWHDEEDTVKLLLARNPM